MSNHNERINRVIEYIYAHLQEDLSLQTLSEVACVSKYHFHRQFAAHTGLNIAQFVKQVRLKRAGYQLAFMHEKKIIDIAFQAGFESHESFSRSFKKLHQQTPSEFRKNPQWQSWQRQQNHFLIGGETIETAMKVSIVQFETVKVAVKQHRGAVERLNDSITTFIHWRKSNNESPVNSSRTFGVAYDDPQVTEPSKFRFDICGEVKQEICDNPFGVINQSIPAGRCAVVRHQGSHDLMDEKIHYLYSQWLESSDEELRDYPCFFHYHNLFPQVAEHELVTDIYLPLKNKPEV